uniref:Uncharacterized protein n=1 Tax=Tetraselmis sp. GSL018 TaxID=582737 RepID=A0A061S5K1_9CHLO
MLSLSSSVEDRFKLCCVFELLLSIVSSTILTDASGSVAVLGLVATELASSPLLRTVMFLFPFSVLMDVTRLFVSPHTIGGFLIFVSIVEMAVKALATFLAYSLLSSYSSGTSYGSPGQPLRSDQEQT